MFDFLVHPPHLTIFLLIYLFPSKCFYSHLPNKWAFSFIYSTKQFHPACLNIFSIDVSVSFCTFLPCQFIGLFIKQVRVASLLDRYTCLSNGLLVKVFMEIKLRKCTSKLILPLVRPGT